MDARQYIAEFADPTIKDFAANPSSRRHAFLACVAVFHTVDYLTQLGSPRSNRNLFRRQSADFNAVDRVAHAFKHEESGSDRNPSGPVLKVSDVIEQPAGVLGVLVLDVSLLDDPIGRVMTVSGDIPDLLVVVEKAAAFLRNQL